MYTIDEVAGFSWVSSIRQVLADEEQKTEFFAAAFVAANHHHSTPTAHVYDPAVANALCNAFCWEDSPQGDVYWCRLSDALVNAGHGRLA